MLKYIYIILFSCTLIISAQSLTNLELDFRATQINYSNALVKLDSLSNKYNRHLEGIEIEKVRGEKDFALIKKLMADAVVISEELNSQQERVKELEVLIETKKEVLDKLYAKRIDSLKIALEEDDVDLNEEMVELEILNLTEKRILVRPNLYSLSFYPDKILNINLKSVSDSSERKIYTEYLDLALEEVDKRLEKISDANEKIFAFVSLQTKVNEFVEEISFDTDVSSIQRNFAKSNEGVPNNVQDNYGGNREFNDYNFAQNEMIIGAQIKSYSHLIQQLDLPTIDKEDNFALEIEDKEFLIEEYYNLVVELKRRLESYKLLLQKKISGE